jgi:hypothetical protein
MRQNIIILWHVEPLLGNDRERSSYTNSDNMQVQNLNFISLNPNLFRRKIGCLRVCLLISNTSGINRYTSRSLSYGSDINEFVSYSTLKLSQI